MSFHAFGDRACPSTVTSLTVIEIMNDVMDENFEHTDCRNPSDFLKTLLDRGTTRELFKAEFLD